MKFHRKRKIESTVDMTPMLDTLLQVHIAFMFLMSFTAASAVKLDLPRAAASEDKPDAPIVISVDAENQMYLNDDLIASERLADHLSPLLKKNADQAVILRADQSLSYKDVLRTLRAVTGAGAAHVHLAYEEDRQRQAVE